MADSPRMSPSVVLLGRDDAVRAQLRNALAELGANVVYESDVVSASPGDVAATSPEVVLLNLDAEGEDALDRLDALLLDPSVKVVFNEAETTASLSGWDLARWARHLAAKVLGHDQTIPPAPEGSEYTPESGLLPAPGAPPTPESQSTPLTFETLQEEASATSADVPTSDSLSTTKQEETEGELEVSDMTSADLGVIDASEIESALSRQSSEGGDAQSSPDVGQTSASADVSDDAASDFTIDFADVELALADIDVDNPPSGRPEADQSDRDLQGSRESESGPRDDATEDMSRAEASGTSLEIESLIDLESDGDSDLVPVELDETADLRANDTDVPPPINLNFSDGVEDSVDDGEIDAAVAALAAQLDSLEDKTRGESAVRDPDFSFDFADDSDDDPKAAPAMSNRPRDRESEPDASGGDANKLDFSSLGLEDDLVEAQKASTRITTEAPAIDIDHLSLEDLPDPGLRVEPPSTKRPVDEPYIPRPGIDLELAPLGSFDSHAPAGEAGESNRAVKADVGESDISEGGVGDDELAAADGSLDFDLELAPLDANDTSGSASPSGIRRVLVLGASIGGPDALRTFLAGLPVDFPALVVLAQHLESGFFDRLAQQLQKVCKLPVRVSRSGQKACEAEVLIIPSGERVLIEVDGAVSHQPQSEPTHYRPSIDDVMRDIADRFRSRATAIIFSGMAGDAVEGAVYVTSKGGEVWAQSPDSCVVSSMVDGAQGRGVVEFVGTPRELADRCVSRYGVGV